MIRYQFLAYCIAFLMVLVGCTTSVPSPAPVDEPRDEVVVVNTPEALTGPEKNLADGCVADYKPGVDYFPEKSRVEVSEIFQIDYFDHYKVVTVSEPFPGASEPTSYVLHQCGTPIPEGYAEAEIITIPVESIVSLSTTYLTFLEDLGLVDRLIGVDSFGFINSTAVNRRIESGEVVEVGSGAEINVETVLELDPGLVMTFASGSPDFDAHPVLEEVGIPVVVNADYLDLTPLGRSEWIKFIAVFFNKDGEAEAWFDQVVTEYEKLTALTATVEERPTVLVNTPFEGTWYVPGGNTYFAKFLEDAGAHYIWADDQSTSTLFLDFEAVFDRSADADFWVNIGFYSSRDDMLAADDRFDEFAAFQNGRIYNNDARLNETAGFDFYESGIARPQIILADLIHIFHPDLLPDHELVYYRPLR